MSARGYAFVLLMLAAMLGLRGCSFGVSGSFIASPKVQASAPIAPSPASCHPEPRGKGPRMDRTARLITAHPGMTSGAPLWSYA